MSETIPKKAAYVVAVLPLIEEEQEKSKTMKVMSSTRTCAKRLFHKV
jgi:hypothetical protein